MDLASPRPGGKPVTHPSRMKFSHLVFPLLLAAASASAQETIRQPTEARFWLKVPAGQPPLGEVSVIGGDVTDSVWDKDPEAAKRQKDVRFPIRWWAWENVTVTFTPTYDGPLDLILTGLWVQEKPGSIFREETLWDEISATGTDLKNGGFELQSGPIPENWTSPWGGYPEATAWPLTPTAALAGVKIGASWHNRPLQQTLQVKSGQKVTLKLSAKSATPPGFIVPKRLGQNTAAHAAAAGIKRGINIGNTWEAPPPYSWGIRYTPADIDQIAAEGFDHIRVPIGWHFFFRQGPNGPEIDPAMLADLEPVLKRALEKKLKVLIDWHHFYDLDKDPAGNRQRFVDGWKTIANHFKSWPPELYFELLNEPHDKLTTELLNPIQADAIAEIRKTNPERIIFLSPGDWGKVEELGKLILPDDERLVVTVHCYEPFIFTHQNSSWTHLKALKNVVYPGPPATPLVLPDSLKSDPHLSATIAQYNTATGLQNPSSAAKLIELLDTAKRWSVEFGRPIHLGEFGAINMAEPESRARYVRDARIAAESRGIPWTMWEWKANFSYWDSKNNVPLLRSALFD